VEELKPLQFHFRCPAKRKIRINIDIPLRLKRLAYKGIKNLFDRLDKPVKLFIFFPF
jgi:hypothetical protein